MGYASANEAAARGADVVLVSGPVGDSLQVHPGVKLVKVESAVQMLEAAAEAFQTADIAILSAAVADYRPAREYDRKIKREKDGIESLELVKNPDIAATLGASKHPGQILVGFALETDHELDNAAEKLRRKNLDMIVLNSLRDKGAGFGVATNKVSLIYADGRERTDFPLKTKTEVAADILDAIAEMKP